MLSSSSEDPLVLPLLRIFVAVKLRVEGGGLISKWDLLGFRVLICNEVWQLGITGVALYVLSYSSEVPFADGISSYHRLLIPL